MCTNTYARQTKGTGWWAVLIVLSLGCKTQREQLETTTFTCNPTRVDQCGTADDGKPLVCYASDQLGGQSFCTEGCPSTAGGASDEVCLDSMAKLRVCRPSLGPTGGGACPDKMSCYRTDMLRDEGVCMAVPVCSHDLDCNGPTRSTCASTIMRESYPLATHLSTSNLHCLQRDCDEGQANCPPGEICLRKAIKTTPKPPDICVPQCDSKLNCPPNFYCLREVSGAGSPNLCLPGIAGFRCMSALDCLAGDCLELGLEFKACGVPCNRHEDCIPYFSGSATYCLPDREGAGKHCVSARPFGGATCFNDAVCPSGQICSRQTVYDPLTFTGECRVPCDANDRCQPRAGLGHVCLRLGAEKTCYPGRFGLPCDETSNCAPTLECLSVEADSRGPATGTKAWGHAKICSAPCQTDEDCNGNPWTEGAGFCEAGLCRLGGGTNDVCSRNEQCRSDNCVNPGNSAGGEGRCGGSLGGTFR